MIFTLRIHFVSFKSCSQRFFGEPEICSSMASLWNPSFWIVYCVFLFKWTSEPQRSCFSRVWLSSVLLAVTQPLQHIIKTRMQERDKGSVHRSLEDSLNESLCLWLFSYTKHHLSCGAFVFHEHWHLIRGDYYWQESMLLLMLCGIVHVNRNKLIWTINHWLTWS